MLSEKWVNRFSELAHDVASWSSDRTKVGCVIVGNDKNIISTGFNGFPFGVEETEIRKLPEYKYFFTEHAERNALYLAKASVEGASLFTTHMPCADCTRGMIQSGIKHVYYCSELENKEWNQSTTIAKMMLEEAKIPLTQVSLTGFSSVVEGNSEIENFSYPILIGKDHNSQKNVSSSMESRKVQIHWHENGHWLTALKLKITRRIGMILPTRKQLSK